MSISKIFHLTAFLLLLLPLSVSAQDKAVPETQAKPAEVVKDAAKKEDKNTMPVIVEHSGEDALGGMLALRLKETLHKSPLFSLADKDSKAMRIKIVSRSEFKDRPTVGSIYTALWTFAENDTVLAYSLSESLGVVDSSSMETTANALTTRTDKLIEQYKFLFE